jgi:DNA polymerase (family 10)
MDNYALADQLSLLAKLMDIHGENAFKAKSYASAAFTLEKLPQPAASLAPAKLYALRGIGEGVGSKILELLQTGELQQLKELLQRTPPGVLEMMNIKGLGPKKIHTLWKEMDIETLEDLKEACEDNRVAGQKGFGAKTQENILQSIAFQQANSGKYLYAKIEPFALALTQKLEQKFADARFALTGDFRRQLEVVETLDWVTTADATALRTYLERAEMQLVADRDGMLIYTAENTVLLRFYLTEEESFGTRLFETSADPLFLEAWKERYPLLNRPKEEMLFEEASLPFLHPARRESRAHLETAGQQTALLEPGQIKGLIHSHSNWSDGAYTLEEMVEELIRTGFEYLVISDHSKAAFYANGLSEERIREQHRLIDQLNSRYAPFRIFKSIECDILNDGSLDYSNDVLSLFDLVITSVHSNLDMDEEKAMQRLLTAIRNPYTTILGHMTGRLLLRRKGYPLDHKAIIDACAEEGVVIEINANPARLDMDWRWVEYALEKKVLLSVNPDAHAIEEFPNIRYGTLVAQKGGLTAERNLSSFSLQELEAYLAKRKAEKGI